MDVKTYGFLISLFNTTLLDFAGPYVVLFRNMWLMDPRFGLLSHDSDFPVLFGMQARESGGSEGKGTVKFLEIYFYKRTRLGLKRNGKNISSGKEKNGGAQRARWAKAKKAA